MKKRLLFLFRYLTTSRHFRLWRHRWLTAQSVLVVAIGAAFLGTMAWSAPGASSFSEGQAVVQAAQPDRTATADPNARPTRTPLPAEYLTNGTQTIGITLAAVLLVIIVVIGVLLFLPRRDER